MLPTTDAENDGSTSGLAAVASGLPYAALQEAAREAGLLKRVFGAFAFAARRLQSELMSLMMGADPGISAFPECDNIFQWTGTITGGEGTVRPRPRAFPRARAHRRALALPSAPRAAPGPAHPDALLPRPGL